MARIAACVGVEPPGDLAAIAVLIAEALFRPIGTSGVVAAPHALSDGKNDRPHLIWPCSAATDMLSAVVICCHFDAPPLDGGSIIEPDLSCTIIRSGGSPRCSMKFCTPQLSASMLGSIDPPEPPVPEPDPPPAPL